MNECPVLSGWRSWLTYYAIAVPLCVAIALAGWCLFRVTTGHW